MYLSIFINATLISVSFSSTSFINSYKSAVLLFSYVCLINSDWWIYIEDLRRSYNSRYFFAYATFLLCRITKRYLYFELNSLIVLICYAVASISSKHRDNMKLTELKNGYFRYLQEVLEICFYPWGPRKCKRF